MEGKHWAIFHINHETFDLCLNLNWKDKKAAKLVSTFGGLKRNICCLGQFRFTAVPFLLSLSLFNSLTLSTNESAPVGPTCSRQYVISMKVGWVSQRGLQIQGTTYSSIFLRKFTFLSFHWEWGLRNISFLKCLT